MRYKHDSMLPIGAFKPRGSVVGGRSMRLHGGDSYMPSEEESRQMGLEHAAYLASQGYTRALDDLRAQDAFNAAQAQQQQQAAQQEAERAQAWASQVSNEAAQAAAQQRADELRAVANQQAQDLAIQQKQQAAEQAAVNAAVQNKTDYVSPGNVEEIRQANLVKDIPFGVGIGQAIGRPYELLNADGEPYKRFDSKGNLTEFVNRLTGEWAKASDVKPVGSTFDEMANKFITEYEYGGRKYTPYEGSGGLANAAFMDTYSKDTGGFFGEGGLAKIATLIAAGFAPYALPYLATAGLGAAGAAGVYGGLTTVGKGLLEGKSFEDSVVDGLKSGAISAATAGVLGGLSPDVASGLGEEFGDIINIGNSEEGIGSFLDAVKESGGKFTGDVSGAGSDMTFDDLVSSTGATQGKGGIEDYYDAAKEISRTNENDVYEALKKYFSAGYEGVPVPGSETAALTTVGATPEQINDLEAMGIKLPQVGGNYSKWHEFADDPSSMVIPPVTNQEIPLVDLTKDGVLSYNDLLDYLTETVGQYGTISKDGVVAGIPDYIKTNINNLLGTSAGIAGLASLIKGGQLAGLGGTGTGGGSSGAGEGSGDGVGDGGGTGGGGAGGIGGGGAGGGGGGGGTGNGAGESDTDLELKRQKLNQQVYPQIQPVIVKPPPVAEIDYMYDIGGESVFATPKQETLMPSPFEEAPEAVEGAMPRYQYYDPQGGYQYADGGMVAFDEGGDVTQEELEAAARPLTYNPKIAAYGERRRETTPPKEMSETDLLIAELAAGFHPVIGPALSAKDFEEAREENNYLGMGLAGLGMIPVVGGAIKGYNRLVKPALRNRAIEKELVENWGKIPKGQPIPEGYIGGPSELPRLPSAKSQSGYYEQPKFQTDYGREFTHDLVHSSPSPNIASFDPTLSGSEHSVRSATLNPSNTRGGSFPNPLLAGTHPADDITTFLSNDAAYSSQYMPRDYVYPTPKTEGKIFPNYSYPRVAGMPKVQKVYDPGATMYPVSARLGKVFDPTAPGADKIAEEFLGTIKMPKGMDEKTFNSYLDSARYSILKGDSKSVESAPFREFLKNEGFDSFAILKGAGDDQVKNYGVFDPSRIRGKYAEFNPEQAASADIMKAEGGFIDDYTIDDLYELLRGK